VEMTPGFSPKDLELAFGDDKIDGKNLKEYFPNITVMLDTFHFIVGNRGISILSTDFGGAWILVKQHFHNAVYASTEQECLVSVYTGSLSLFFRLYIPHQLFI
jgi:hypothetical protein